MNMELMNKIVVLTGATSGIGLATAKVLCKRGAHVIGIGRSHEKCEKVKEELNQSCAGKADFIVSDLSSLQSVRVLAEEIKNLIAASGENRIDVLIHNAGTFTSWYMSTAEGFEMQFAVNHLAPFLLTHLLLPLLRNAPDGRVISVSSGSHYHTRIHWKDILLKKHYNCLLAYKQSKLANVLFIRELRKRLGQDSAIHAYAADPGLVNTDMGLKSTTGLAHLIWSIRKNSGDSPSKAAHSLAFLASEEALKKTKEIYYKECMPKQPSPHAMNEQNATRLWGLSEKMCGIKSSDYGLSPK